MQLKKTLLEWALGAEMSVHPGYEKGHPAGQWHSDRLAALGEVF